MYDKNGKEIITYYFDGLDIGIEDRVELNSIPKNAVRIIHGHSSIGEGYDNTVYSGKDIRNSLLEEDIPGILITPKKVNENGKIIEQSKIWQIHKFDVKYLGPGKSYYTEDELTKIIQENMK